MRDKGWMVIALVMALAVTVFTSSCSKKVVQSQATSTTKPEVRKEEVRKEEVRKAPEKPAEKAEQAARPAEVRPKTEAAPREAGAREAASWVFVNEHVLFPFDSSLLTDRARLILQGKAEYLRSNPEITVTVEGHCDDRGTNTYNSALGERRAVSVKTFLVDQGIGTNRVRAVSYGEERPVAVGHNEDSWAKNRRAQFVIN